MDEIEPQCLRAFASDRRDLRGQPHPPAPLTSAATPNVARLVHAKSGPQVGHFTRLAGVNSCTALKCVAAAEGGKGF